MVHAATAVDARPRSAVRRRKRGGRPFKIMDEM
jgi:hypothetical protein